jgi:spore maturation protein CgeB
MHLVIFGLSVSSSWGNGHATLWRGLLTAMAKRNHTVTFYEADVPYYARTRDEWNLPHGVRLRLYSSWNEVRAEAARELSTADLALSTSYCPDGPAASRLILDSGATIKAFYDLDTPVTLNAVSAGRPVDYLPDEGLGAFDLVLSYTGGRALADLQSKLGARLTVPLYGSVDPKAHCTASPVEEFRSTLSYLGTYSDDRQEALEELFVQSARRLPSQRFLLAGAQYPTNFPWTANMFFVRHLPPSDHSAFFSSSRATLNVTRRAMVHYGFCPSGRLFEAAACGTPILSDSWEGLDNFFTVGEQILLVQSADDVIAALSLSDKELHRIGTAARQRALDEHSADHRIIELEAIYDRVLSGHAQTALNT